MYFEVSLCSLCGEGNDGVIAKFVLVDRLLTGFESFVVEEDGEDVL